MVEYSQACRSRERYDVIEQIGTPESWEEAPRTRASLDWVGKAEVVRHAYEAKVFDHRHEAGGLGSSPAAAQTMH